MADHRTWSSLARTRAVPTAVLAAIGAAGLLYWRSLPAAWIFLTCAMATLLLVPRIARWAIRRRVLALPGGRDRHGRRTPRAGGIALFVPVAVTLIGLAILGDTKAWGLLAGSAIVFGCGLVDDVRRVGPRAKILAQMAAGAALLLVGFRLPELAIPGLGSIELGFLEIPFVLFWVVLVCNAFDLSDGLDGLASSLAMLGLAVLVAGGDTSLVPIALAGTCLGFLHYNMPPARIFLGDSGSLLLGFLLAALALELPVGENVPLALAACAYPLGDVAVSVMRRFARGKPLFSPDASHVHHKFVDNLGSPRRGLLGLLIFASAHGVFAVFWPGVISITLSAILWIGTLLVLARLASFRAGDVLDDRPSMRRLHALQRYVRRRLDGAESRREVVRALQHFVEGAGLCSATLEGIEVLNRDGCCALAPPDDPRHGTGPCEHRVVRMMVGRAAWRAPRAASRAVVDRERETVVVSTLRRAHARLGRIGGVPAALDPMDAPDLLAPPRA